MQNVDLPTGRVFPVGDRDIRRYRRRGVMPAVKLFPFSARCDRKQHNNDPSVSKPFHRWAIVSSSALGRNENRAGDGGLRTRLINAKIGGASVLASHLAVEKCGSRVRAPHRTPFMRCLVEEI